MSMIHLNLSENIKCQKLTVETRMGNFLPAFHYKQQNLRPYMSKSSKLCLSAIAFLFLLLGAFLPYFQNQLTWITSHRIDNQLVEVDFKGELRTQPDKIASINLETKFLSSNDVDRVNLAFKLNIAIDAVEKIKSIKPFSKYIEISRKLGYQDNQILEILSLIESPFKIAIDSAIREGFLEKTIIDYLIREDSLLVVEEIIGYKTDLIMHLIDQYGRCILIVSYQMGDQTLTSPAKVTTQTKKCNFIKCSEDHVIVKGKDNIIIPPKELKTISDTNTISIPKHLAERVKLIKFWPVIKSEERPIAIYLDRAKINDTEE